MTPASATSPEQAVDEIDREHRLVLNQSDLTPELLRGHSLSDFHYIDWGWHANICIDSFMACPTGDESDAIVVCSHDAGRARTSHTGVFIGDACQTIVFEYDQIDENSLRTAAYDALLNDDNDLNEELRPSFPPEWVECNRDIMPAVADLMPGLRFSEFRGNGIYPAWDRLRLYIFDNRPSALHLH